MAPASPQRLRVGEQGRPERRGSASKPSDNQPPPPARSALRICDRNTTNAILRRRLPSPRPPPPPFLTIGPTVFPRSWCPASQSLGAVATRRLLRCRDPRYRSVQPSTAHAVVQSWPLHSTASRRRFAHLTSPHTSGSQRPSCPCTHPRTAIIRHRRHHRRHHRLPLPPMPMHGRVQLAPF